MTIRKKLVVSNVLMLLVPVIIALAFAGVVLEIFGKKYGSSVEEIFENESGIYTAQYLIYAYEDELVAGKEKKVDELAQELSKLGYHFQFLAENEVVYSNLTDQEISRINQYSDTVYQGVESLLISDREGDVIRLVFEKDQTKWQVDATGTGKDGRHDVGGAYLKRHIFSTAALFVIFMVAVVILTNIVLTGWVTHSILKPLKILKKGAKEIADGNLEFVLEYHKPDEFGEVCREFDEMRGHLKESVDTRIEYEQYRRDLIVGISHDLRTPLTSIKGYVEGLKDGIADTSERRERYYDAIHIRALNMESLVESLSTFAKLENRQYRFRLEKVDMDEYLKRLLLEYREEGKQNAATILYDNYASEWNVMLDIQEMQRVFMNLFANSIKYRTKKQTVICITLENQGKMLAIRVADDGPGVPDAELTQIFKSFYRVDESRSPAEGSSGLGLSIVKQIIEGHKGSISAYNEKGLVILIMLPLVR